MTIEIANAASPPIRRRRSRLRRVLVELSRAPTIVGVSLLLAAIVFGALLAPVLAPQDPFDLASIDLADSLRPPSWVGPFPLGADEQGRDVWSMMLYGARSSLAVSFSAVLLASALGITLGLAAGYRGGMLDAILMRAADVQLSFPAMLTALLVTGVLTTLFKPQTLEAARPLIVIFAIGISQWPQFARTVRASTMVERGKDYVLAAELIGVSKLRILVTHVLPNVFGPALVIGTLNLGQAVLSESTLSFLGVGFPPTYPTLGTMVRLGNDMLFSGVWWVTLSASAVLAAMVLSINMLGEWLRDVLDPRR
jgi:peptide/nickel transport system permease protein